MVVLDAKLSSVLRQDQKILNDGYGKTLPVPWSMYHCSHAIKHNKINIDLGVYC